MKQIISFRFGSSSDAKKADAAFNNSMTVTQLLDLTPQPGILCNEIPRRRLDNTTITAGLVRPPAGSVPQYARLRSHSLPHDLQRHVFYQHAILNKTNHTILRILTKFPWHVPDFPIYPNQTKPRTFTTGKAIYHRDTTPIGLTHFT